MQRIVTTALAATLAVAGLTSAAQAQEKKQLVFVVNAASDFWKLAEAGIKKANAELPNYDMQLRYPATNSAARKTR